jgi:hypothetical protein
MSFGGGGFFGSGAKQSSTTSNTTNTTNEAGFSEIHDSQVNAIQGDGNSIVMSDMGAINAAQNIAQGALTQVELANNNASSLVGSALSTTADTVAKAVTAVSESSRAETENIIINIAKWAAIAGMVFAGAWALKGFHK